MRKSTFIVRVCWTPGGLKRAEREINNYYSLGWESVGIEVRREWFRWVVIAWFTRPGKCDCDCDVCSDIASEGRNCACDCCMAHHDPDLIEVADDDNDDEEEEFS